MAQLPFSLLAVVAVVVFDCRVLAFSSRDHYAVIAWIETKYDVLGFMRALR